MISTIWKNNILRKITAVAFWVTVWFIIALIVDNELIVASPIDTCVALGRMVASGELFTGVAGSLCRIMLGFVLGIILASGMAVMSYRNDFAYTIISLFMNLCKAVPVAAFSVILIIWWGPGNLSLLISMIVVLPIMYSNILEGLNNTDIKLLEMSKVLDVPNRNTIAFIFRPALAPYISAAFKAGVGMCWKAGVAAEVIGLCSGSLGGGLYTAKVYFDTAAVFAWATVTVVVSYAMERLVLYITEKLINKHINCSVRERSVLGDGNIILRDISKKYGTKTLYEKYNVNWKSGENYRLEGESGSGKTTLLRMIAGLDIPDSGTIECKGKVSMMFQEDRLCEDYSAICNVALTGVGENRARTALEKVLDEDCLDKPCRELSGGMKRRVALVRAMECPSDVVLLDEPYTGLDEKTMELVKDYICVSQKSKTVIIASHIL